MAGKGRPITNFSNYWHPSGLQTLQRAARRVLRICDPYHDRVVTVGDLVSVGWLRSFRYADDSKLKFQYLHAVTHMLEMYPKLRWEKGGAARRVSLAPLPDFPEGRSYVCPYSQIGFLAVDLLDDITAEHTGQMPLF